MFDNFRAEFRKELDAIREAGTYKEERVISSPQSAAIAVPQGEVINFCANNYLGLADNPEIIARAKKALDERGFGMASVRFICGTQDLHKELEDTISAFNGTDDTILYSSCFDANAGLFETILGPEDAIISDQLNHASIIDGVRLCKAERFRYANSDMEELEAILEKTGGHRRRLIATDGVFSMDGYLVKLDKICDLAERYNAMVMVDDSHATGYIGKTGRGTRQGAWRRLRRLYHRPAGDR
jgi:glycine C-acetyltransferase